jgi:hypothetical protein
MKSCAVDCGNFNLRGIKTIGLSCKCCVVINFRESYRKTLDIKEIQEYKRYIDDFELITKTFYDNSYI